MKTNELRLGNYISVDCIMYKKELKVTEVCPDGVFANPTYPNTSEIVFVKKEDIEPIELIEELLLKIGFKKVFQSKITKGRFELNVNIGDNEFTNIEYNIFVSGEPNLNITQRRCESLCDNSICKQNIKYLHELQNAYYCLTGQELNIEL